MYLSEVPTIQGRGSELELTHLFTSIYFCKFQVHQFSIIGVEERGMLKPVSPLLHRLIPIKHHAKNSHGI